MLFPFKMVGMKVRFTADVAAPCVLWTEGIISTAFAIFGLIGNAISIW